MLSLTKLDLPHLLDIPGMPSVFVKGKRRGVGVCGREEVVGWDLEVKMEGKL